MAAQENIKTVDSNCRNCVYLHSMSGMKFCAYIMIEEKCRPCPAGKGCTVKKTGKRINMRTPLAVVGT